LKAGERGEERRGYLKITNKYVAVFLYITLVDKQGIIPYSNAVFDIYKRFWIRSLKHLFFLSIHWRQYNFLQ